MRHPGPRSSRVSRANFLRRFSKKCHFFEKWYFLKIPTSHISRPAPTDFRLWLGGSPTGTSIVRRSHLPLPTSCLLKIWFQGTLYVQQVRIGNYGFDVGRVIGRLLHEPRIYRWLPYGWWLLSVQQWLLTCWRWLRPSRCTTLPGRHEPDRFRASRIYPVGLRSAADRSSSSCHPRSSDLPYSSCSG